MVQKALTDGKLLFGEKPKSSMKVDSDPIQIKYAHYVEPLEIMMVEATEGFNMEVDKGDHISAIVDSEMQTVYPVLKRG